MLFFRLFYLLPFTLFTFFISCAQPVSEQPPIAGAELRPVGGPCEGCEATLEYGKRELNWIDTFPDYYLDGQRIEVRGTVYRKDGKTPAPGVVLYIYHTDQGGEYTPEPNATGWARRHGKLRTWLKTDEHGRYAFFTLRPASYPGTEMPAHIHIFVGEPGLTPYYIDAYEFADDPFLTEKHRKEANRRGGSGILANGQLQGDRIVYERNIILGLNVEDYGIN